MLGVPCAKRRTESVVAHRRLRKIKRRVVRYPTRQSRLQLGLQIRPHIQISAGGTAAQPLDRAADQKIDFPIARLQLHRAGRLIDVEQHQRAMFVRPFDDRLDLDAVRAAKRNMRQRDQRGVSSIASRIRPSESMMPSSECTISTRAPTGVCASRMYCIDGKVERAGDDLVALARCENRNRRATVESAIEALG